MLLKVPYNARTIATGRDCLRVVFADLDRPHSASMLFQRDLHHLRLFGDSPNTDLTFRASRNYPLSVRSSLDCSASVVVGIVYHVQQFS